MNRHGLVFRFRLLCVACLSLGMGLDATAEMRVPSLEYQIRSAFLLNFARYIEWPRKTGDISICLVGPDVFGTALSDGLAKTTSNSRRIVIRKDVPATEARHCDIAYISLEAASSVRSVLESLESLPVLTVGEDAGFIRIGGMIGFVAMDGKVRFYINPAAASHARLGISSRLLVLGKNVRDEGERRR